MAKVIENIDGGRRKILLSGYDVISIVRSFQYLVKNNRRIDDILDVLREHEIYLPEDF